ncbi:hypothetical protein HZC21_03665 [Candidatus Peregrinibacteria bacterium]|nr:hypothetical protein [Candidatus Peregrinibacteria bacterium]
MKSFKRANTTNSRTKLQQCDILILTGSVGSGHTSAARAICEAVYRINSGKKRICIVDFFSVFPALLTKATKKLYFSTLKLSPKIWGAVFDQSAEEKWSIKLLNSISAPLAMEKLLNLFNRLRPRVLVSTYPVWDILARKAWNKYCSGEKLPFISVITDSVTVHSSWISGNPDYFLVSNKDTKTALKNLGIRSKKIKTFGYPTSHLFQRHHDCATFLQNKGLSNKKKTLLLILTTGTKTLKIKRIANAIQKSKLKNLQLVIIACVDEKLKKYLEKIAWPWPTCIKGWTNEMHNFIHGADIILTKAGGATIMECIASGKPMIIIDMIPGQEIGNATMVQKYNLGAILDENEGNFDAAVQYIFTNEKLIKKNLSAQQKPHAAEDIAKFLINLISN